MCCDIYYAWFRIGINQLKEKWIEYKQPRKLKKLTSLFISPSGDYVAVASGNLITILHKKDDYSKPFGTFSGKISWLRPSITCINNRSLVLAIALHCIWYYENEMN